MIKGAVALGSVLALGLGVWVAQRIRRSLVRVQDVAQGIAAGDLTRATGIAQRDEVGRTAAALDLAQGALREVLAGVVAVWVVVGHALWMTSSSRLSEASGAVLRAAGQTR